MRILMVSAHFPPNFVSGGTLAPQRLAHGLAGAGHDVSVYAGWLDSGRTPLESWTSTDDHGLSVRWVVTTPWIDWSDRRNYDNPAVTADFARHVAELRPEVVHFHSLQSLGAGLLPAARAAGATVVVTMHDFWWLCARQFLATPQLRPCCPVIACGNCPCEVDSEWLAERAGVLRGHLECADVVLAVSRSVAEVLVANGLAPGRVQVDENSVPPGTAPQSSRQAIAADGVLRLTYAGGPHPLKGVHVVIEAAGLLSHKSGWRLTTYGAQPYVRDAGVDLAGLPVELRPPFEHERAEEVFTGTDVLLVPSVAQESYSLITREALARGIPVVCSDSLGPEEVVVHGRNGLIVPAGDAPALAEAVRRLLDEPGLLHRLRSGCGTVTMRALADQVEGLQRIYRDHRGATAAVPATTASAGRTVRRVLFLVGIEGAPLRYRARLPAEALTLLGVHADVRHYRDSSVLALAEKADTLVVYRVPATVQVLDVIAAANSRGASVFYDVDDLIFDPALVEDLPSISRLPPAERELYMEGVRRYRTTLEACDAFIGSTGALCRHAEAVCGLPSARFDNGVGILLARLSDAAAAGQRSPGPLRIGYLSGTTTHDHDWLHVEPAVARLLDERPELELWLGALVHPSEALDRFGPRVRRLPFAPWQQLPVVLRDLDVNLAPLQPDSAFNEAKSAIKWLEAALTATPTVASPTEPFREVVRHGENGLLASSLEEWYSAVGQLLDDELLRGRIGRRARRDALLGWSPHSQGRRYLDILTGTPLGANRPDTIVDRVVHDEPFTTSLLEPYEADIEKVTPPEGGGTASSPLGVRSLVSRAGRSLRKEGVASGLQLFLRRQALQHPEAAGRVWRVAKATGLSRMARKLDMVVFEAGVGGHPLDVEVPSSVPSDGRRFSMFPIGGTDLIVHQLAELGWYGFERPMPDVFVALVNRHGGTVVDVGANTGLYSILSCVASARCRVVAFEPFPPLAGLLDRNLRLNRLEQRVTVSAKAISASEGVSSLYVPLQDHGLVESSCSLNPEFKDAMSGAVEVQTTTVDAYVEGLGLGDVNVVKIDVESLEHAVLQGAEATLERQRPIVFFEVLHIGDPEVIDDIRKRLDYVDIRLCTDSAVVGDHVHHDPEAWNHVLVPAEVLGETLDVLESVGLSVVRR